MRKLFFCLLLHLPGYGYLQPENQTMVYPVKCSSTLIKFQNKCRIKFDEVSFVHVHEDETTAVNAANRFIDSVGKGCFVTWKCQQQRYVSFKIENQQYRFDPNRIYTDQGIRKLLKTYKNVGDSAYLEIKKVAAFFTEQFINGKKLVIALHNNTNEGGLSVTSYKKGGLYEHDAKLTYINSRNDPDDFFYTTDSVCYSYLKQNGFNVVLQNNVAVTDDGSLSVYCAVKKIPYVNIEAQSGHMAQQLTMLKILWSFINDKYIH